VLCNTLLVVVWPNVNTQARMNEVSLPFAEHAGFTSKVRSEAPKVRRDGSEGQAKAEDTSPTYHSKVDSRRTVNSRHRYGPKGGGL